LLKRVTSLRTTESLRARTTFLLLGLTPRRSTPFPFTKHDPSEYPAVKQVNRAVTPAAGYGKKTRALSRWLFRVTTASKLKA